MAYLNLNFVNNFSSNSSDDFFEAWEGPTNEDGLILIEDANKAIKEELKQDTDFLSLFMRDCDLGNVDFLEIEGATYIGPF